MKVAELLSRLVSRDNKKEEQEAYKAVSGLFKATSRLLQEVADGMGRDNDENRKVLFGVLVQIIAEINKSPELVKGLLPVLFLSMLDAWSSKGDQADLIAWHMASLLESAARDIAREGQDLM